MLSCMAKMPVNEIRGDRDIGNANNIKCSKVGDHLWMLMTSFRCSGDSYISCMLQAKKRRFLL